MLRSERANVQKLRVVFKLFASLFERWVCQKKCSIQYLCHCRRTWHIQLSEALPFDNAQFIIRTSSIKFIPRRISLYRCILNNIQLRSISAINVPALPELTNQM